MKSIDKIIEKHKRDTDHYADQDFDEDIIKKIVFEYCNELIDKNKALIGTLKSIQSVTNLGSEPLFNTINQIAIQAIDEVRTDISSFMTEKANKYIK